MSALYVSPIDVKRLVAFEQFMGRVKPQPVARLETAPETDLEIDYPERSSSAVPLGFDSRRGYRGMLSPLADRGPRVCYDFDDEETLP